MEIKIEVPDAIVARFKALIGDVQPKDALKNLVKSFILNKELEVYAKSRKEFHEQGLSSETQSKVQELRDSLEI